MRGNHHKITIAKRIEKLLANIKKTNGLQFAFSQGDNQGDNQGHRPEL
jgi:hypothetical protein